MRALQGPEPVSRRDLCTARMRGRDERRPTARRRALSSPMDGSTRSPYFLLVTALFVTALLTSNIVAVKLVNFFGIVLPAAVVVFPLSYIVGDVLTEVYGYNSARRVIWLGFFCNALAVLMIWVAGLLPPAPFWDGQAAYQQILGYSPRLLVASFLAYLLGEFANSFVLARLKIATKGRWLWLRTISSTLVGQALDSLVFMTVAFAWTIPFDRLFASATAQWLTKSCFEALATPFTYVVVGFLKEREGTDIFDYGTNFSPFSLG